MSEKKVISMSEFKTVIEGFRSDIKKMSEVMMHEFQVGREDRGAMKGQMESVKEQIALLHEGQTTIKSELKEKVAREEFSQLEMRVAKLENKVA